MAQPKRQGPKSGDFRPKSEGVQIPRFINPNPQWPFPLSYRDGFVLVNVPKRETQAQRLAQVEEARW